MAREEVVERSLLGGLAVQGIILSPPAPLRHHLLTAAVLE